MMNIRNFLGQVEDVSDASIRAEAVEGRVSVDRVAQAKDVALGVLLGDRFIDEPRGNAQNLRRMESSPMNFFTCPRYSACGGSGWNRINIHSCQGLTIRMIPMTPKSHGS